MLIVSCVVVECYSPGLIIWPGASTYKVLRLLRTLESKCHFAICPGAYVSPGFLCSNFRINEEELIDQGIKPNTIRWSIGTEHIDDIIADLELGFAAVK